MEMMWFEYIEKSNELANVNEWLDYQLMTSSGCPLDR